MAYKMIKPLSILFVILALFSCSNNKVENDSLMVFKAFGVTPPSPLLSKGYPAYYLIDKKKKISTGDNSSVSFALKDCETAQWICISDGGISFAIKTDWKGEEKAWKYDGFKYTVIDEGYDLGEKDTSYFILSESIDGSKNLSTVFLYSIEKGLLSMTFLVNNDDDDSDKKLPITFVRVI